MQNNDDDCDNDGDDDGDEDDEDDDGEDVKKNHRRQTDQASTQTLVTSGDFQNTKHAQPAQTNKQHFLQGLDR